MGGGNSRMMLENRITTDIENSVKNHTDLVNKTVQNVTLSYIDKVKNSTSTVNAINNLVKGKNIIVRGKDSKININQRANINASLKAQSMVSSETRDRTNLAAVMKSALDQAVTSNVDADVSQKAVNVMEQMDQNDGGVEGVINKGFDTMNNMLGGGNTEQDVKNISETKLRNNTENILKMRNEIETNLSKEFGSETKNICKSSNSIDNIVDLEAVQVLEGGEINIEQVAALDSATSCFNEVFNIREISTDVSADSGMDAKQALDNISKLKQKQDVDNKLKQTKLQKNILSSLFGSCFGLIILAVIAIGGMGVVSKMAKDKKGGTGGAGMKSNPKIQLGIIAFRIFIVAAIGITIYILIEHTDVFKKAKKSITDLAEKFSPSRKFIIKEDEDDKGFYRILTLDKKYGLVSLAPNMHSSKDFKGSLTDETAYIGFMELEKEVQANKFKLEEDSNNEGMYRIISNNKKGVLKYNSSYVRVNNDIKRKEEDYELYDASFVPIGNYNNKYDFMISDIGSETGSEIKYVNRDSEGNDNENYSVLYSGDKAMYGKELAKINDLKLKSAEFRRPYTDEDKNANKETETTSAPSSD